MKIKYLWNLCAVIYLKKELRLPVRGTPTRKICFDLFTRYSKTL